MDTRLPKIIIIFFLLFGIIVAALLIFIPANSLPEPLSSLKKPSQAPIKHSVSLNSNVQGFTLELANPEVLNKQPGTADLESISINLVKSPLGKNSIIVDNELQAEFDKRTNPVNNEVAIDIFLSEDLLSGSDNGSRMASFIVLLTLLQKDTDARQRGVNQEIAVMEILDKLQNENQKYPIVVLVNHE